MYRLHARGRQRQYETLWRAIYRFVRPQCTRTYVAYLSIWLQDVSIFIYVWIVCVYMYLSIHLSIGYILWLCLCIVDISICLYMYVYIYIYIHMCVCERERGSGCVCEQIACAADRGDTRCHGAQFVHSRAPKVRVYLPTYLSIYVLFLYLCICIDSMRAYLYISKVNPTYVCIYIYTFICIYIYIHIYL